MFKVISIGVICLLMTACTPTNYTHQSDDGYSTYRPRIECRPVRPGFHPGTGQVTVGEDCGEYVR